MVVASKMLEPLRDAAIKFAKDLCKRAKVTDPKVVEAFNQFRI